ncbi:diguanylate cyclase [Paenibacillus kobensis]|uniref:diguanylate cyclase n=1 Tax=Paenibacillus kobensis TaxID=59841 RepID=UPI0013E40DC7|nr:diguanylate cyclase [Paenibacillus kobensis]
MPRLGLRHRFVIAVTLSMLVPTSLVSLLAYRLIDHQAEQFVNERIHSSLYSINQQIDHSLSSAYEDSEWLSQLIYDSRTNGALRTDWNNVQEWLQLFLQKHDNYNYILVKKGLSRELIAQRSSYPIPDLDAASSTVPGLQDRPAVAMPPYQNADGQLETTVVAALPDGSGTINIGLSLESVSQQLVTESNTLGVRFMLADSGRAIISDSSSQVKPGTLLNDTAYTSMFDSSSEGSYLLSNTGRTDMQLYYSTVRTTGWKLAAEAPLAIARSAATPMLRSIAFIIVLTMLIGIFVAALFATRALRPIRAYREAFTRISEGDCSVKMPQSSRDEWGRLGGSFNRMLKSLQSYAFSDPLTGLPDRRRMTFFIERQLKNASESGGTPFAVWFIDVDNFKQMNDTQGHAYGDEVVRQVARELQRLMPPPNIVARFGGDEFVMLMPEANDLSLRAHATKLQERFDRGILVHGELLRVQLSVGVAVYPKDGETLEQLVGSADHAMYRAKRKGKNNIQFH